jgi:hypothetical protein
MIKALRCRPSLRTVGFRAVVLVASGVASSFVTVGSGASRRDLPALVRGRLSHLRSQEQWHAVVLGNGTTLEKAIPTAVSVIGPSVNEVSAGQYFACANDAAGATWCWGSSLTGQLGTGSLTDSTVPLQPLSFLNPPLFPAGDLSTKVALASALLMSGVALLDRRARRRRARG